MRNRNIPRRFRRGRHVAEKSSGHAELHRGMCSTALLMLVKTPRGSSALDEHLGHYPTCRHAMAFNIIAASDTSAMVDSSGARKCW